MPPNAPIVLQLAPLPRTQIGPFLILGVDKDASRDTIEAAWAEKVKQARRGQIKTPLEDINWAREMLTSKESRIRCDAVALNIDTTDGALKKLALVIEAYGGKLVGFGISFVLSIVLIPFRLFGLFAPKRLTDTYLDDPLVRGNLLRAQTDDDVSGGPSDKAAARA